MAIRLESMAVTPYAKFENILARSPLSEFMPCPGCGELVRYRYECNGEGAPPKMIIGCPDCGTYSIVPFRFENDRMIHKVLETGSDYNLEIRIDAVKAKLDGLGDECTICERAVLTAELAWESKVSGNHLPEIWSDSVELFRDAISAGEDARSDLTEAILRFIPMTGWDVREVTARAAKLLTECYDAPSTARECAVWLWYACHDVNSMDPQNELEDNLHTWNIAKDAFLAMPEEEQKAAPRLPSLMDLWESDLVDYLEYPDDMSADDRCRVLLRSSMEKLYDSLEAGVPLEPAHFDMLLYGIEIVTAIEGNVDVLDDLLDHKKLFIGNEDIIESFAEFVRIQMTLCDSPLLIDLLLVGILTEPEKEHVVAMENVLKNLEEHVSLEYAGRTLIQSYLLFAFMIGERGCIEYAEKCAENLAYRHQDYGDLFRDIYAFAERQGLHDSGGRSSRTSRKDRAKKNKDVRKAHAERRRAEGGSKR